MIDVARAIGLIEATARPLGPRRVPLATADGLRLAEAIVADGDSPPWDRAMMDGFAVRDADIVADGVTELDVFVELAAGDVTRLPVRPGACARIMTGAPLPPGADAVVPVECATDGCAGVGAGGRVRLRDGRYRAGQHVARRGTAFRRGQVVLPEGTVLTPAAIGLAVEAGATHVVVAAPPRVAILGTGSELVSPDEIPRHGQTRNSNGPMLAAAVRASGGEAVALGTVVDRPEAIRAAVAMGLAADLLVLSGGVSAGDLDLVPETLVACGVDEVFHKVRMKPGKPVWFGKLDRGDGQTLVFGLPGNPASSLVCFELFVRPALAILRGLPVEDRHLPRVRGILSAAARGAADRPVYAPCRVHATGTGRAVEPLPWSGSSDLVGLSVAEGLMVLPAGSGTLSAGTEVEVVIRAGRGA